MHSSRGNFFHHSPSYWGKLLWDELFQIPKGIKGSPMLPFLKLQEAYLSSTEGNPRWQWRVPVKEAHPRTSKMGLDGKEVSSYLCPSLPPFLLHVSIMSHTSLARHPSYRRILHLSTPASPGPAWLHALLDEATAWRVQANRAPSPKRLPTCPAEVPELHSPATRHDQCPSCPEQGKYKGDVM